MHTVNVNIPIVICLGVELFFYFFVMSKRYWRLPKNDLDKTVGHALQHASERLSPSGPTLARICHSQISFHVANRVSAAELEGNIPIITADVSSVALQGGLL
jgi:hypothetical protein